MLCVVLAIVCIDKHLFVSASMMAAEYTAPIIEVAFSQDTWWSLPRVVSEGLYDFYLKDQDAGYTWDWGEGGRIGSYAPNGEQTHISRYAIDFINNVQTNIDSGCTRSIRIVWVRPQDVEARFAGERRQPNPGERWEVVNGFESRDG